MPTFDRLSNLLPTIFDLLLDVHSTLPSATVCSGRRESFPPQAVGSVSGAPSPASSAQGGCQVDAGIAFQTLSLATGSDHRPTGHFYPLASARLSAVLEAEITAARAASHSCRTQKLIVEMADDNPTWGEERIAAELLLKVGIRLSPRTVRRYMPNDARPKRGPSSQRWMAFVRNHAEGILACDFFITVTASFRVLYVFLIMEVGTRRIAHVNVAAHPTAGWALQQFREVITGERPCRFLLHDRDRIYSSEIDSALKTMGLGILKTPFRAPQANAFCERLVGSIRRECLDFLIPLNERHLRGIVKEWAAHYNKGRPHSSLGPGIPEPSGGVPVSEISGHRIPSGRRVVGSPVLSGLHHEYRLEEVAA